MVVEDGVPDCGRKTNTPCVVQHIPTRVPDRGAWLDKGMRTPPKTAAIARQIKRLPTVLTYNGLRMMLMVLHYFSRAG
jgi:hypothetical protein